MSGTRKEDIVKNDHFSGLPAELVEKIFKTAGGYRPASELRPSEKSKLARETLNYGNVSKFFENVVEGSPGLTRYSRTALATDFTKLASDIYDYVIPWGALPRLYTSMHVSAAAPLYKLLDAGRQLGFRTKILSVESPRTQADAIAAIAPFYGDMEPKHRSQFIDRSISILKNANFQDEVYIESSCEAVARGHKDFSQQEREQLNSVLSGSSIKRKAFELSRSKTVPESAPDIVTSGPTAADVQSPADLPILRDRFNQVKGRYGSKTIYLHDTFQKLQEITPVLKQVRIQYQTLISRGKASLDDRARDRGRDTSANGL